MKLEKMRNLYYVENIRSMCTTAAIPPSQFIVIAGNPKEAKEFTRKLITLHIQGPVHPIDSKIELNDLNLKVKNIGLTNKKKRVMFSWMC